MVALHRFIWRAPPLGCQVAMNKHLASSDCCIATTTRLLGTCSVFISSELLSSSMPCVNLWFSHGSTLSTIWTTILTTTGPGPTLLLSHSDNWACNFSLRHSDNHRIFQTCTILISHGHSPYWQACHMSLSIRLWIQLGSTLTTTSSVALSREITNKHLHHAV